MEYNFIAKGQYSCTGNVCGTKYTHHTLTPIIKHNYITSANKHPGKKSFINKYMRNPYIHLKELHNTNTDEEVCTKLCISHKDCLFTRSTFLLFASLQ